MSHKPTNQKIAESFSMGDFEGTFPIMSEGISWRVVGEKNIHGKSDVVSNCEQTREYFESVETVFKIEDSMVINNKVVVRGSGEFLRNGKRINLIEACDVYEFNEDNQLAAITSYCIPENG